MTAAVTGERVTTSSGWFNPTWQRHVAAYVLSEPFLARGRVIDVGCGVGHSYELLEPRETVGVDLDPRALEGQNRETTVADMRNLPFPDDSFDGAIVVHAIEHVPDPERALAEVARVTRPGGAAVFVTPNRLTFARPDEIIDPYHFIEFDPGELGALCRAHFGQVEVAGIAGSERYMELVAAERAKLDALLRLDPLRVRRLVPRRLRQRLYDRRLRRERDAADPAAAAITPADFTLVTEALEGSLDLLAICR